MNNQDNNTQTSPRKIDIHSPSNSLTKKDKFSDTLRQQMKEICHCLMNFIREQKPFNNTIEQNIRMIETSLTPPGTSKSVDPVFQQSQQQVLTQGLIVNLNSAYREIAVLQSEINSLQSKNSRLSSSKQRDQAQQPQSMFQRDDSEDSIYSIGQIKIRNNEQANIRYNRYKTYYDEQLSNGINIENSSNTPCNSQSTGKQTTIYVENKNNEPLLNRNQTPTKHEQNTMYTTEQFSSPKLMNYQSDYDTMSRHVHRRSSKDNIETNQNKPFKIHQRPLSSTTDDKIDYSHQKKMSTDENRSPLSFDQFDEQKPRLSSHLQTRSYIDQNSDDDIIDQYRQYDENLHTPFSPTSMLYSNLTHKNISSSIFNVETKPSDLDNVDIQTLDLQIKSIMVHLIPYMRLHINEIFNLLILNEIKDRILFLSKQQPDSSQFVRNYQNQFSSVLTTTIAKYCGKTYEVLTRKCSQLFTHTIPMENNFFF
ncbi:unnamed protein product [Didymodactylos carnosus]|uniref:Pericentriolar material 1 protein C-terminal domain-containing protein n=1 Tax=Didymodactylos carnosus TaxID=1234261 RepID=A0A8S2RWX5_9BILA|nr:unnamed protein product [Didymodactylos carnosus]